MAIVNIEEYKASEEKIKTRHCPVCGKQIKIYYFDATLMPIDAQMSRALKLLECKATEPIVPFNLLYVNTWFHISLASRCQNCGHIDHWQATKGDIDILLSDNMNKQGFYIMLNYDKSFIQSIIDSLDGEKLKEYREELTKLAEILK